MLSVQMDTCSLSTARLRRSLARERVPPSGVLRERNGTCFSSPHGQKKQGRKVHVRLWLPRWTQHRWKLSVATTCYGESRSGWYGRTPVKAAAPACRPPEKVQWPVSLANLTGCTTRSLSSERGKRSTREHRDHDRFHVAGNAGARNHTSRSPFFTRPGRVLPPGHGRAVQ
jgi:hypothetical protein